MTLGMQERKWGALNALGMAFALEWCMVVSWIVSSGGADKKMGHTLLKV